MYANWVDTRQLVSNVNPFTGDMSQEYKSLKSNLYFIEVTKICLTKKEEEKGKDKIL